jgi:hypothetical protein
MLVDDIRQLKTIHFRHTHIHQDDGNISLQQKFERFSAGIGLDLILPKFTEHDLITEQLAGLIVNHEDTNLASGAHLSSESTADRALTRLTNRFLNR